MKKVRKLLRALMPRVLDVCVYEYMLSIEPPDIHLETAIDVSVRKDGEQYAFYATHRGNVVNENHIIFKNRLGRQLGYSNVPMLADSSTQESYRGKGIQIYMLTEIVRYFAPVNKYDAIYVFTFWGNHAMQRSLQKAGYVKLYRAKVYRIAGLCIFKKMVHE
jgi:GNAT superfamily N-acetyltransferase